MKFKWGTRKLTFVVIRGANESVIQFRLSTIVLFLLPALIILSLAAIFILSKLYMSTMNISQQLESRLQEESAEHHAIVTEKDQTIEELMSDVVELTNQSELVQEKLIELQQISNQIKRINGDEISSDSTASLEPNDVAMLSMQEQDVMVSSIHATPAEFAQRKEPTSMRAEQDSKRLKAFKGLLFDMDYIDIDEYGRGGKFEQVSVAEILLLAEDTKAHFKLLNDRMSGLKIELEEAKELAIEYQHLMRITPSIWPTKSQRITSSFGYRRDPFSRRISHHSGIDFGGKTGDPVYATADGKVVNSSYDSALGHHIIINHSNGIRTLYAHLSKRLVSTGDQVEKGDTIGRLGSTGRSTGPHLHYEVYKNGVAVNPKPYLP